MAARTTQKRAPKVAEAGKSSRRKGSGRSPAAKPKSAAKGSSSGPRSPKKGAKRQVATKGTKSSAKPTQKQPGRSAAPLRVPTKVPEHVRERFFEFPPSPDAALPDGYRDDAVVLLPRDSQTAFLFWDFAPETLQRAREDLSDEAADARVRALRDGVIVDEVVVSLESGCCYLQRLPPQGTYRAQLVFVGTSGRVALLGESNSVRMVGRPRVEGEPVRFARVRRGSPAAGQAGGWSDSGALGVEEVPAVSLPSGSLPVESRWVAAPVGSESRPAFGSRSGRS